MITADIAVRGFVFVLALLAMLAVGVAPAAAVCVLVHRHTHSLTAFWLTVAGLLAYGIALSIGVAALVINTGFVAWVTP